MCVCRMLDNKASSIIGPKRILDLYSNFAQKKQTPHGATYVLIWPFSLRELLSWMWCSSTPLCAFLKIFIQPHCLYKLLHAHLPATPTSFCCFIPSLTIQWIEIIPVPQAKEVEEEKICQLHTSCKHVLGDAWCEYLAERETDTQVMSTLNSFVHALRNPVYKKMTWERNLIRGPQRQNCLKTEGLERIKGQ